MSAHKFIITVPEFVPVKVVVQLQAEVMVQSQSQAAAQVVNLAVEGLVVDPE